MYIYNRKELEKKARHAAPITHLLVMLQKHSRPSHGVADPSTMTAVSPYAPTARNQFLQRHGTPRFYSKGACLAIFLLLIKFWDAPQLKRVRTLLYTRISETACGQVVDHHARLLWSIMYRMGETIMERIRGMATTRGAVQEEEQRMIWKIVHDVAQGGMERIQRIVFPLVAAHWYEQNAAVAPQGQVHVREESDAIPNVDFVRRNQQCIQSILHYWFGQYSPENSQKKLWMIASSSAELRERVDADIAERFQHVITSLSQENGMWQEWCHDSELYGYTGKIAAILALDQFSRHLTRYYSLTEQHCTVPPQSQLDERAYKTAQLFTQQHEQEILCGMVPLPMYVFALMPYRHASTIASVQYVQECIDKTTNIQEQMDAMLRRFRSATNRRHAVLQDEARRTGATEERDDGGYVQQNFTDEDILEVFPFDADMSTAEKHIVYKTVASFLADRGIERKSTSNKTVPVIISLSGGVDSMVIASVLAHLRTDCGYNIQIVGIHIDYANRPESGAEAAYVQRYCERLGITYKCRTIDEVTRGVTARDDYERIAREARYDFYRKTVAEHMHGDADIEVGVMLGHHRGDLRENVLSNSHKGCGPLDLSGMTAVSKNDGVVIYRPLLPLEKRSIYDYAHSFGVPYFKDTTPHWSTRGKLRNKLLPLLQEIYGEGSMNNLSTLATESDEARELLQIAVLAPFLDQVERKPMGITFATKPWKAQGLFFWKFVLREALHSAGLGMFSEKSVISFLERIQADRVKPGWLQCRRDYAVYLQEKEGRAFVFFPESFPFRKSDQFDCVGQAVGFGEENGVSVGPWRVKSEVASGTSGEADKLLKQKAVASIEDLFHGRITYYLKTPVIVDGSKELPQPLVFVSEFNRQTRPLAWKQADLKIQATLPLLGTDETTEELTDDSRYVLVRVSLTLTQKFTNQ